MKNLMGRAALAGIVLPLLLHTAGPAAAQPAADETPFTNTATVTWTDANANAYTPAGASVTATVETPLPVELSSLTATADGSDVVLRWETASETNNAGFEVQHALVTGGRDVQLNVSTTDATTDAPQWHTLAFVEGHGTTAEPRRYTYTIAALEAGRYRFRLKQVDYDGAFEHSPEVEVLVEVAGDYQLSAAYPNPFNPETRFSLAVRAEQHVRLAVYDLLGRPVALVHDGVLTAGTTHRFRLDAGRLASGAYVLRATGERFVAAQRVVLLK